MLTLTMMNDNDVALKFKATIRILFLFGQIIVLIIHVRPNSQDPLFGTALISSTAASMYRKYRYIDSVFVYRIVWYLPFKI